MLKSRITEHFEDEITARPSVQRNKRLRDLQTRWMIRRDLPEVMKIERDSFASPWTEEGFLCCLRQWNCIGVVVERDHCILGFAVYELHKSGLCLTRLAVSPQFRRQSVGLKMIQCLIESLSRAKRASASIMVRESNLDAQLFFREMGFRALATVDDHFPDGEAAYLFRLESPGAATE